MSGLVSVFLDAWEEVRVHKARVILSLIGVVLAVFAMTVTTAAGMIVRQIAQQELEMFGGRSATLRIQATSSTAGDEERVTAFYESIVERYRVKYNSQVTDYYFSLNQPGRVSDFSMNGIDPDWAVIHRMRLVSGRWLGEADAGRLAPSVVVNKTMLENLGENPNRPAPFVLRVPAPVSQTVVVVGTSDRYDTYQQASMWLLRSDGQVLAEKAGQPAGNPVLELWVPPEAVDQLTAEIERLGRGADLDTFVQPPQDEGFDVVFDVLQILILALSVFGLFLGALGVLNVGVVTVRQRVRELGVKRALGASAGRIFAAIMLESVLATVLAGLLGIALAVALVNNIPWSMLPDTFQLTERVPFPVGAAVQGFIAATVVGALAGLVPAIIAVQSKVIDAIRY